MKSFLAITKASYRKGGRAIQTKCTMHLIIFKIKRSWTLFIHNISDIIIFPAQFDIRVTLINQFYCEMLVFPICMLNRVLIFFIIVQVPGSPAFESCTGLVLLPENGYTCERVQPRFIRLFPMMTGLSLKRNCFEWTQTV